MKKLNKLALFLASAALVTVAGAQTSGSCCQNTQGSNTGAAAAAPAVDNWKNGTNELVWKNGTNELCWRDNFWTPATAAAGCDGAIVPVKKGAAPVPAGKQAPAPAPIGAKPAPAVVAATKVTFAADAFFDFDKAVLKPEGKAKLDDLVGKIKDINLEVIVAVGHTDSIGSDAYNQKLSLRRSEAVKAYLVSKGVEKSRVYTEGKGEKQPVADNKTSEGRAKNRRVEIEVVGARANK